MHRRAQDLEPKDNVAIYYHYSDDHDYYVVQLHHEDPWYTVPKGETLKCEGLYDKEGEFLEFAEGARVLRGHLYSLRNKKEKKYELHDAHFAEERPGRINRAALWPGWPVVYFPIEMLIHAKFHMTPVNSNTARREKWYVLDVADHDAITTAARHAE